MRPQTALLLRLVPGLAAVAAWPTAARADVACPAIFSDHMVLQRDKTVAIWGRADAGEPVEVSFAGRTESTTADARGHWSVALAPLPASSESRALAIRGRNVLTISDVLVGEIWLCFDESTPAIQPGPGAGAKATTGSEAASAAPHHPLLRLYPVPRGGEPAENSTGPRWIAGTPEAVVGAPFPTAGVVFAREIQRGLRVPVGLIHAGVAGTRIEAWMPPEAFASSPKLAPLLGRKFPAAPAGVQPTELHHSMIAPLVPFTLRGFLWRQGEANCLGADGAIYAAKLGALITSWRALFRDEAAPFYFAQLAPFPCSEREDVDKDLTPEALPLFWEAQARALALPGTALVVATDLADSDRDIAAANQRETGLRFARLALARTYARDAGFPGFAQFVSTESLDGGRLRIHFKNTGGALRSRDGQPPTHFTVAGRDKRFAPAAAEIEGDTVVVSSPQVPAPLAVRFGWHETADPNLVNAAGLPVVPFRTDGWPIRTERPAPAP